MLQLTPPFPPPPSRRIRLLEISLEIFLQFMKDMTHGPLWRQARLHGLPADATLVGSSVGNEVNTIFLLIQSEEFDEVPDSLPYPELTVTATIHEDAH